MKNSVILRSVQVALMAVFIAVCAFVTIPFPVPFTLQTLGVYLTLLLLKGKRGTCAIALYILLGVCGVPVFSSFGSGAGYLLGPTGGYLLGFILLGGFTILTEALCKKSLSPYLTLSIGTLLCYAIGTVWFVFFTHTSPLQGILLCTLPYVLPDALKLIIAVQVAKRLEKTKILNNNSKNN